MNLIKIIAWAIGCPFVFIWFSLKWFSAKSKSRKYKKNPEDFLNDEKYDTLYKLAKPTLYFLRIKVSDLFKDKKINKKNQLIIANHRSFIDSLLLFMFLYEQLGPHFIFVAKKELESSKLGHLLKLIDTIFIDRNNLRQMVSSINDQIDIIKNKNKSVIIFPEGTRNTSNELLEFKSGAFEVAYKTMCTIQPIVFMNTEDYWENRKGVETKRPLFMEVLEPYQSNTFLVIDRQIFTNNVQKNMQDTINKIIKKTT